MKNLIKIDSNVPSDVMRIELFLSNYCNYNCFYCTPDSYGNTHRWPQLDTILPNLDYLISYYKNYFKKKHFDIFIGGGEPTLWPELIEFIKALKSKHNCKIYITTNGSRTLRWWNEYGNNFDHIMLSVHHERADADHLKQVGDILYEQKVSVISSVLMDPFNWQKCVDIVETLKTSRHKWYVTALKIFHSTVDYSIEQQEYLENRVKRSCSFWYKLFVVKSKQPKYHKPTVYFEDGSSLTVDTHWIQLHQYHHFWGWDCTVGLNTLFIDKDGNIRGSCGEPLYGLTQYYNIYDKNFVDNFTPEFKSIKCTKIDCICQPEANINKRISSNKKIIPIVSY